MSWVRPPAVAGSFYSSDPSTLRGQLEELFKEAEESSVSPIPGPPPLSLAAPKALIAPHAGYVYSGPVAASGYARLSALSGTVKRVVLLGPAHRVPFRGLAASTARAFETPLGTVPLDQDTLSRLVKLPGVHFLDRAHEGEHSLEVHLPFLQWTFEEFSLVPLVVGEATFSDVADVLGRIWGGGRNPGGRELRSEPLSPLSGGAGAG